MKVRLHKKVNLFIPLVIIFFFIGCTQGNGEDNESLNEDTVQIEEEVPELESQLDIIDRIEEVIEKEVESVFCETNFDVYLFDPGEEFTNVRDAPGGKVIISLPWSDMEDTEYMLTIIGAQDGWFKIKGPIFGMNDDIELPNKEGWVHHSVVAADTRNYANQPINIHQDSNDQSDVMGIIKYESTSLKPLDACGKWVEVEYRSEDGEKIRGWIDAVWVCGNPLTNCN